MGSISTVSSQTFKTYCFRAEGEKKDEGKEEKEEKTQRQNTCDELKWRWEKTGDRACWEEMDSRHLDSGGVKVRAVIRWPWGLKRKTRLRERGDSGGKKGGGKEGGKLRMSSGRTWKWASIIAVACSCSAGNNFTFPSHSSGQLQTRTQTLFTGNPANSSPGK